MYNVGDNIRIKAENRKQYYFAPSFGVIESIYSGWIAMRSSLGVLHIPQEYIQHDIYK